MFDLFMKILLPISGLLAYFIDRLKFFLIENPWTMLCTARGLESLHLFIFREGFLKIFPSLLLSTILVGIEKFLF